MLVFIFLLLLLRERKLVTAQHKEMWRPFLRKHTKEHMVKTMHRHMDIPQHTNLVNGVLHVQQAVLYRGTEIIVGSRELSWDEVITFGAHIQQQMLYTKYHTISPNHILWERWYQQCPDSATSCAVWPNFRKKNYNSLWANCTKWGGGRGSERQQ